MIAVVVVLAALLLPETQWVADGQREFPVQVYVFDLDTGKPIPDAEVCVIKQPGYYSIESVQQIASQLHGSVEFTKEKQPSQFGLTNSHGTVILRYEFPTSTSNRHPKTRVYPFRCWVVVSAPGFRGTAVPVGQFAVERESVFQANGFLVPIGITPDPSMPK